MCLGARWAARRTPHNCRPSCPGPGTTLPLATTACLRAARTLPAARSELTDPVDQRARLEAQVKAHHEAVLAAEAAASAAADAGSDAPAVRPSPVSDEESPYEVVLDEDFLTGARGSGLAAAWVCAATRR